MPCIQTKTNIKLSEEKESVIRSELGKAIGNIPGKSESWLMLTFEDECRMSFKGDSTTSMAFVEVKIFGKANASAYGKLTGAITGILSRELGIGPGWIYIKYEETPYWGWDGSNF